MYFATGFQDVLFGLFQIFRFDYWQRRPSAFGWIGVEAVVSATIREGGVGGAVVLKGQSKEVGVEGFACVGFN